MNPIEGQSYLVVCGTNERILTGAKQPLQVDDSVISPDQRDALQAKWQRITGCALEWMDATLYHERFDGVKARFLQGARHGMRWLLEYQASLPVDAPALEPEDFEVVWRHYQP